MVVALAPSAMAQVTGDGEPPVNSPLNPPVTAQDFPTPTPTDIAEVESLYRQRKYDDAIKKSTPFIQSPKESDPRLLYYRGRSAFNIGALDMARNDLGEIGDFSPYRQWPAASPFVRRIEKMRELTPKKFREIKSGDEVIFRVYYDEESLWSDAVMQLLPQAYAINFKLLNKRILETPVYIFSDFERFKKFYALNANGIEPSSWVWAAGKSNGIYFCQNHPTNVASHDVNGSYFKIAAAHEFNHCVVGRIVGGTFLPNWFSEGLAMTTSPEVNSAIGQSYDTRVRKAREANGLLTMRTISQRADFKDSVEKQNGSDAYAQGYSMTAYLLALLTPEKLTPFLEEVRHSGRFDAALSKFTGLSPDAFYDAWVLELQG